MPSFAIRGERAAFPPPSLHVSLLRIDPWNEFVSHGPTTAEDLLMFRSCNDEKEQELRSRVYDQLTVISGSGPQIPAPSIIPEEIVSMIPPIPLMELPPIPNIPSFIFRTPTPEITSSSSVKAEEPKSHEVIAEKPKLPEEEPLPTFSVWSRVQSAWSNLKNVGSIDVPSWFSAEQGLVVPTDPEIRATLGSVYGGTKSAVIVSIRAIEAIDVPVLDWTGASDPYISACIVRGVGGLSAGRLELLPTIGSVKSTTPKFATLNPKWNETIQLDKADLLSVISDSVLHVSMWDKDIIKADDPVGFTTFSLIDSLQLSGVSPFPLLPIQMIGSLIGPHAGIFAKVQLRMVQSVGVVSVTPIALQGFTRGWKNYSIRVEIKVTESDPIASSTFMTTGLTKPETSPPVTVNETGHALWPKTTQPLTVLFSAPKKSKPYLHVTLKSDSVTGDAGQVAIRIGLLERVGGISALKLMPLDGSPADDKLRKCSLYCGVECELTE
jgi:hypothetical protein